MSARIPLVVAAGAMALFAACGGGGSKASSTTTTTGNGRGAALAAFRTCMASHGVKLPDRRQARDGQGSTGSTGSTTRPSGGGFFGGRGGPFTAPPGVDQQKYNSALNACRSQVPAFGNNADNAQFRTAYTAYLNCLKNHGVQGIGDVTTGRQALANVDRTTPAFQAADQACRPLLPARPSTTTTSAGA